MQYNTGFSNVYIIDDYFIGFEPANSELAPVEAFDLEGKTIYEVNDSYQGYTIEKEYFYLAKTSGSTLTISKYATEDGHKIKTATGTFSSTYQHSDISIYLTSNKVCSLGLAFDKDLNPTDTSGCTYSNAIYYSNELEQEVPADKISKMNEKLISDGFDKNDVINSNRFMFRDHVLKIFSTEGNILNMIFFDKDVTDYEIVPIFNSKIHKGENYYIGFVRNINDLLVVGIENDYCLLSNYSASDYFPSCGGNVYIQIYDIDYEIFTKTDGNGTIKASTNVSYNGESVTFEITPKEGYVLGEVRVTDANGKTVVFKDYKFTMPSSDVTIEATFVLAEVKENPNTKDILIFTILTLSIISLIIIITITNKIRKTRNS